MSRFRSINAWAKVAIVPLSVALVTTACDEDGKSLPAACADPLPLDDLGSAGTPDVTNPCVTPIGDAVSYVDDGTSTAGGAPSGGGAPNGVGQGGADAGAGGS
jgi:hypothetical protein